MYKYIYIYTYTHSYLYVYVYTFIHIDTDIFWALNIYCHTTKYKLLERAWSSTDRSLRVMASQRQHPSRTDAPFPVCSRMKITTTCWLL